MSGPASPNEPLLAALTLCIVGGFLDSYTFLTHGVFANAQTGNIVLLGVDAAESDWRAAVRHVPPVVAFIIGMITAECLARTRFVSQRHRATAVIVAECLLLTAAGLAPPTTPSMAVTFVITFASTLQVGTFRQVRDTTYNSTFTTGNLRSVVSEMASWIFERDAPARARGRILAAVVSCFLVGTLCGGIAVRFLHEYGVLVTVPALLAVLAGTRIAENGRAFAHRRRQRPPT